jgi:hypothetical protein
VIEPEPVYIPYSVFRATSPLASPVTAGFCVWLFHSAYFEIVSKHHTQRKRRSISSYPENMSKLFQVYVENIKLSPKTPTAFKTETRRKKIKVLEENTKSVNRHKL